ncbi:MAG: hypothetical protein AAF747_01960 [Planctomycetota bacterium]
MTYTPLNCAHCGYDISDTPRTGVCPECGKPWLPKDRWSYKVLFAASCIITVPSGLVLAIAPVFTLAASDFLRLIGIGVYFNLYPIAAAVLLGLRFTRRSTRKALVGLWLHLLAIPVLLAVWLVELFVLSREPTFVVSMVPLIMPPASATLLLTSVRWSRSTVRDVSDA